MRSQMAEMPSHEASGGRIHNFMSKVPNYSKNLPHFDGGGQASTDDVPEAPSANASAVQSGANKSGSDDTITWDSIKKSFQNKAKGGRINYADGTDSVAELPAENAAAASRGANESGAGDSITAASLKNSFSSPSYRKPDPSIPSDPSPTQTAPVRPEVAEYNRSHPEYAASLSAANKASAQYAPPTDNKAHGGKICKHCGNDPTQQRLLPGDKIPNSIEKSVVNKAERNACSGGYMAEGGRVRQPRDSSPKVQSMPQNYADGTDSVSSPMQDTPEQIASDASANQPQQVPDQAPQQDQSQAITPELAAKRSAYNQQVASMYGTGAAAAGKGTDPSVSDDIAAAQFGPNGEPPANFNSDAWQKASTAYDQQQNAETAQKQQAAQQIDQSNQARIAAGLPPIPVTSDMAASAAPKNKGSPGAPTTQVPDPNAPQPGDKELSAVQNSRASMGGSNSNSAPVGSPPTAADTAQKLVAAKQLSYDALMHERQTMLNNLTTVQDPKTMGQMFTDAGFLGKLKMMAGLMLGGGSSAILGQQNNVMAAYQNSVNNELNAQRLRIGQQNGLLANNLSMMGNATDAMKMSKINMMDYQMHQLVQLAAKYPNNPQIQQNLQTLGMMGIQSTQNLHDTLAASQAWRHAAGNIQDPTQKIQFNPYLTPDQKNEALKQLGDAQNLAALRDNTLDAFDQVAKLNTPENRLNPATAYQTYAQIEKLKGITLDKLTKDTSGRVTPQTVELVSSTFKNMMDNKITTQIGRDQLAKILSQTMHFPMLDLAGVNVGATPQIGGINTGPPKLGK